MCFNMLLYSRFIFTNPATNFLHYSQASVPEFAWWEVKEKIGFTIRAVGVKNPDVKIEEEKFSFSGKSSDGKSYEIAFDLKKAIDVSVCVL